MTLSVAKSLFIHQYVRQSILSVCIPSGYKQQCEQHSTRISETTTQQRKQVDRQVSFAFPSVDNAIARACQASLYTHALEAEMGLFTRKKVDGEVGTDAPVNDTTASDTTNGKTGISRFARRRQADTDVPVTRSATAGALSNKAIRLVQLLLAILILGLTAYAVDIYQATFVSEYLEGRYEYTN